jgi:hypothetical protein
MGRLIELVLAGCLLSSSIAWYWFLYSVVAWLAP